MGTCAICGKSGWFLSLPGGVCRECLPGVENKFSEIQSDLKVAHRAIRRVRTLDTRVGYFEDVLRLYEEAAGYAKRGVEIRPVDPETGKPLNCSWEEAIQQQRKAMDEHISEEILEDVQKALAAAKVATSSKKQSAIIHKMLLRIDSFRERMAEPSMLDEAESMITPMLDDE